MKTEVINLQLSNNELSYQVIEQLLNEVNLGLISKAQAISFFQDHLLDTYGYRVSPKEFPYLTIINN